jgi:uncharacterized protein YacL
MFTDIANFSNVKDYLPLLNGSLITELIIITLVNIKFFKSVELKKWYEKYNLSAVIADVFIVVIGLIITRAIYYYVFDTFSILRFVGLAVIIQIIHDILFYIFFTNVPRGINKMLDTFKDYAKETSYIAILGDSFIMIMASLIASFLAGKSLNTNIIVLIVFVYILPYVLYN